MMLEEANARLKKAQITSAQLEGLNSLYILLDLPKDAFCKIVDLVGLDILLEKQMHYDRLLCAEQELAAKERYFRAKSRLEDLEAEKAELESIVEGYNPLRVSA